MIYIIAGVSIALCIAVITWGLKILKEDRKFFPKKKNTDDSN